VGNILALKGLRVAINHTEPAVLIYVALAKYWSYLSRGASSASGRAQ
jgi:hypothetical protein